MSKPPPSAAATSGPPGASTAASAAGSALQFVVQPLPGSAEQLADKLREVGERLRLPGGGHSTALPVVPQVAGGGGSRTGAGGVLGSVGHPVAQIEVVPSHFAFLLEDGRICR